MFAGWGFQRSGLVCRLDGSISYREVIVPVQWRSVLTTFGMILLSLRLSDPAPASPLQGNRLSRSLLDQQRIDFALKDRDRVVFYGDSITEQRLYTTYVEQYVLTHYPDRRITFINTGWGGDKVSSNDCKPCAGVGGLARIKRDVIDHRPTVVTLLFRDERRPVP